MILHAIDMFNVVKNAQALKRKIAHNKTAMNYITKDITTDISLGAI